MRTRASGQAVKDLQTLNTAIRGLERTLSFEKAQLNEAQSDYGAPSAALLNVMDTAAAYEANRHKLSQFEDAKALLLQKYPELKP